MKLCVVPQEPTLKMLAHGSLAGTVPAEIYGAMLSYRPPLPEDIERAVELAKYWLKYGTLRGDKLDDLARALLRVTGREG